MAADLDYLQDGTAAVVSIGETPWHREGTIKLDRNDPEAVRLATDLDATMERAGLTFRVEKFDGHFRNPSAASVTELAATIGFSGPSYTEETLTGWLEAAYPAGKHGGYVVRTDRMKALGFVGPDFHPLQNVDAFGPVRSILERGLGTIETAGALKGGADVWMLVRLVPSKLVELGQRLAAEAMAKAGINATVVTRMDALAGYLGEVLPFAHFSNHHAGKRAATVQETGIRVVCSNTQSAALDGDAEGIRIAIRHDGADVAARYAAATDDLLRQLTLRYLSLADARVILKARTLTQEEFERTVLETAVPVHHLEEKVRNREGNAHTKSRIEVVHRLRDEIQDLWINGKGHVGDRSAWEAMQGVIEWLDHSPNAKHGESRLQSLQGGTLGRIKTRVSAELFELAEG